MDTERFFPPAKIGIIGGGQLGKMMCQEAKRLGYTVVILDPQPNSPAGQVADKQIIGGFYDGEKIRELVEQCAVSTYEIEHVDTQTVRQLVREGHVVYPQPEVLEVIQDKLKQKQLLVDNVIPTAEFCQLDKPTNADFVQFGFPLVQKARKGGYDGRGVVVLQDENDLNKTLPGPSILERLVDLKMELAVMVARGVDGALKSYPVVELVVDTRANILDLVVVPARISESLSEQARILAEKTVDVLQGVGIFGVEMFLSKKGDLFVNEVAPRPHNSGHYTIEACVTSQFEQHLRAITGLPFGETSLLRPSAMLNLVGEADYEGYPVVEGLAQAMAIPGVSVHIYGKLLTKPFRKMGHVTVLDNDVEKAILKALQVKGFLKIKGDKII